MAENNRPQKQDSNRIDDILNQLVRSVSDIPTAEARKEGARTDAPNRAEEPTENSAPEAESVGKSAAMEKSRATDMPEEKKDAWKNGASDAKEEPEEWEEPTVEESQAQPLHPATPRRTERHEPPKSPLTMEPPTAFAESRAESTDKNKEKPPAGEGPAAVAATASPSVSFHEAGETDASVPREEPPLAFSAGKEPAEREMKKQPDVLVAEDGDDMPPTAFTGAFGKYHYTLPVDPTPAPAGENPVPEKRTFGITRRLMKSRAEEEEAEEPSGTDPAAPAPRLKPGAAPKNGILAGVRTSAFWKGISGENSVFRKRREGEDASATYASIYQEEAAGYHEYTSRKQISLFSEKFVSEISFASVRIFVLAFLCTFLLVVENVSYFGITLGGFFSRPAGLAALYLLALFFCVLASVPLFSYAWRQLFAHRIVPELFVGCGLLVALVYNAVIFFSNMQAPYPFGLLPAFCALISTVAELAKTKGDYASFKLVSSAGDKLACMVSGERTSRSELRAVADMPEGDKTRVVSAKKVGFVTGFFRRINRNCEDEQKNLWLLPPALTAAALATLISGLLTGSVATALYTFCMCLTLSFPACALLLHKAPAAALFRRASANRCAVVGEVSAVEYDDADAIAFEDVEAFPARNVRVQRIKLYGDSALDHVMYQVSGVFSIVGGPLDGVFRSSTAELGLSTDVQLLQVSEGGLVASVDGVEVSVGRGEYMLKRRVHVYYDAEDEQILSNGKTSIMYAAEDGRLIAKFYIRYKMDEDFERNVEELYHSGLRTLLRTYDPNIREALISHISYTENFGIRVVRKTVSQQQDFALPQLNSGIVSKSSARDILRTLLSCRKMCALTRQLEKYGLITACAGMALGIILAAFGAFSVLPTAAFVLYQAALVLPVLISSRLSI